MSKSGKTIEVKVERTIEAPAARVFAAWLNPKIPGTPWNEGNKLILQPKVNGLFYWLVNKTPHYGRFTELKRGSRIRHTWMSPYTEGQESTVTVNFKAKGRETVMTLVHTGLPANANGRAHIEGWHYFMDKFPKHFGKISGRKNKR